MRHHPTQEDIAVAAYFLWEKNGEVHGEDLRNWFEAELALQYFGH